MNKNEYINLMRAQKAHTMRYNRYNRYNLPKNNGGRK